jgi:tRNA threonylcarbamoyladenosine biosynthesis protein TsaB
MGGPGSFTGLRIGFSLAKGLALSLGIPFVPVPTLDCMAYPFTVWPGLVVPVIDAKKNAFFCALYRDGKRLGPDMDAEVPEIARAIAAENPPRSCPVLLAGPDAEKLYPRLLRECALPEEDFRRLPASGGYGRALLDLVRRDHAADIAQKAKMMDTHSDVWFSGPEYIRKSDAELNVRQRSYC